MSWYSTDISGLRMQKQMSDREMRLKERESQLRNDPGHIFMSALMQAIPNSAASALGSVAVDAAKWNWFGGQEEAGSKIMARDWTINQTQSIVDAGPYMLADQTMKADLVDSTMYPDEFAIPE